MELYLYFRYTPSSNVNKKTFLFFYLHRNLYKVEWNDGCEFETMLNQVVMAWLELQLDCPDAVQKTTMTLNKDGRYVLRHVFPVLGNWYQQTACCPLETLSTTNYTPRSKVLQKVKQFLNWSRNSLILLNQKVH